MRTFTKLLFTILLLGTTVLKAQTVSTFENLFLSQPDTFYVNYSNPNNDVGFINGLAYFPCYYDTSFGYSFWSSGFAYSNMTDSITSGIGNQYSAKTAIGYNNSAKYAVVYVYNTGLNLLGAARGKNVAGFYATNNTYAYNSMRDGDMFARKFVSGDWFKLTVHGFLNDTMKADSVDFYLADFRFNDTDSNYIVNTWKWVDLMPLGHVDSLSFTLSSTDTGMYGMNTPAYFCMDNLTTAAPDDTTSAVQNTSHAIAKVYPNPATNVLNVQLQDNSVQRLVIYDMAGRIVDSYPVTGNKMEINTAGYTPGNYMLQLIGTGNRVANIRFTKQ
jgi:hypothetical protein